MGNFVRTSQPDWTRVLAGSISSEMMVWLGRNVRKRWTTSGATQNKVAYFFEDKDEAFDFMMRWGGGKIGLTT